MQIQDFDFANASRFAARSLALTDAARSRPPEPYPTIPKAVASLYCVSWGGGASGTARMSCFR